MFAVLNAHASIKKSHSYCPEINQRIEDILKVIQTCGGNSRMCHVYKMRNEMLFMAQ